jgi:hypothetical protein
MRDYERLPAHHEAMVKWAMIALMARRPHRHGVIFVSGARACHGRGPLPCSSLFGKLAK